MIYKYYVLKYLLHKNLHLLKNLYETKVFYKYFIYNLFFQIL